MPHPRRSSPPALRGSTIPWLCCAIGGALLAWAGCSAGGSTGPNGTSTGSGGSGGSGGATTGSSTASNSASSGELGGFGPGATGTGTGGGGVSAAYAHTNTELFQFDPASPNLTMTKVGAFDCIGGQNQDSSVTDIAVSEQGDIWGISTKNVYHFVPQNGAVHCASTTPLNNVNKVKFFGLTFAPAGVLDPNKEVLVAGNTDGELWAIDANGALTLHGNFGKVPVNDGQGHTYPVKNQGQSWELSGDIVFLANNNQPVGFATVRDCPTPPSLTGCNTTDTLLEIDISKLGSATTQSVTKAVRGEIVKRANCADPSGMPYGGMYGIAAWDSNVYGFAHSGAIVDIDNVTGGACLVSSTTNLWDGAGVTTVAPVVPPPPPK